MQITHGLREAPQPARLPGPWRQRLGQIRRITSQRAVHEAAQVVLGKAGGSRVNRRQPVRQRRPWGDDMKARMHDFEPEVAFPDVAECAHALAGGERFLLAGIEVKEAQYELRLSFLEQANQLPPRPIVDLGVGNGRLDLPGLAGFKRLQRTEVGMVLVAQGKMQHQVLLADNVQARELVCERVTGLRLSRLLCLGHARGRNPPGQPCLSTRIPSTSTRAPFGSPATWYVARAG